MLRPTGQSDKIQSIKSNQYIGYIGSIGSIGYIGSIVHTGNIPPVKWINQTKKTQKGSELKNRHFDGKIHSKRQILTKTLYLLPVCAVILHLALCRKHILKMPFLRLTFFSIPYPDNNTYVCLKNGIFKSCFRQSAKSIMTTPTGGKHHVFGQNSTLLLDLPLKPWFSNYPPFAFSLSN